MTKIYVDINQFGKPHWLTAEGRTNLDPIRKKYRDAWLEGRRLDINEFGEANWIGPVDPEYVRLQNHREWLAAQKARRRQYPSVTDYNPNHYPAGSPDSKGGQFAPSQAAWIREKIDFVADKLHFPKDRIHMSTGVYRFELNDKTFRAAGLAIYNKNGFTQPDTGEHFGFGDIVIYDYKDTGFTEDLPVHGIVAHEIEHQRYREVTDRAEEEFQAMIKHNPDVFKDTTNWDEARKKYGAAYPTLFAMHEAGFRNTYIENMLSKTDGVTDYSTEWWKASEKNKSSFQTFQTAINETVAEIASLDIQGELRNPPKNLSFDEIEKFVIEDITTSPGYTEEERSRAKQDPWDYADAVNRDKFLQRFGFRWDELGFDVSKRTVEVPDFTDSALYKVLSPEWQKLYDTINEQYKRLNSITDAGFDPNQERDEHGRWTREGEKTLGAAIPDMRKRVDKIADDMGYPKEKIFFSNQRYVFQLNGNKMDAAAGAVEGVYKIGNEKYVWGDVVIFKGASGNAYLNGYPDIEAVVAHEISHQMFSNVMDEAKKEYLKARRSGLKENELLGEKDERKYPTMWALQSAGLPFWNKKSPFIETLRKDDGVTPYSDEYWKSTRSKGIRAIDETLAEIWSLKVRNLTTRTVFGLHGPRKIKVSDTWMKLHDTINEQYHRLRKITKDAGFDPNQERDYHGRWTRTGQTKLGKKAEWIRNEIDKAAKDFDYPAEKIFMSLGRDTSIVNGQEYASSALAIGDRNGITLSNGEHYEHGDIILFGEENDNFNKDVPVRGVIAHEIMHQKFRTVLDQAAIEVQKLGPQAEVSDLKDNPEFATVYAMGRTAYISNQGRDILAATDGVTPYSQAVWNDELFGASSFSRATHETLAEMARLQEEGVDLTEVAHPAWRQLFDTVNDQYRRINRL